MNIAAINTKNKGLLEGLLYYAAAALTPKIYLFHLYNANKALGVLLSYCLIFGLLLSLVGILVFFCTSKFMGVRQALLSTVVFWLSFWVFCGFSDRVSNFIQSISWQSTYVSAAITIGLFTGATIVLCCLCRRIKPDPIITITLAAVFCMWSLFNLTIALGSNTTQRKDITSLMKTEFRIDAALPNPDIYWLHLDGMMSFQMVEKLFGDSQTELKSSLGELGFVINETARLEAGFTRAAVPALVSPELYDSYLGKKLAAIPDLTTRLRMKRLFQAMSKDGYRLDDAYRHAELFHAFMSVGYRYFSFDLLGYGIIPLDLYNSRNNVNIPLENLDIYLNLKSVADMVGGGNSLLEFASRSLLFRILGQTKQMPEYTELVNNIVKPEADGGTDKLVISAIGEALSIESPKISYINTPLAHASFILDENGVRYPLSGQTRAELFSSPELYYPQHKYATHIMLEAVRLILARDPSAVIVLQADHGIHSYELSWMKKNGYTDEEILDMNFATFSAVRVPEGYGVLKEALEPTEITKWLVNNFVGQNYGY